MNISGSVIGFQRSGAETHGFQLFNNSLSSHDYLHHKYINVLSTLTLCYLSMIQYPMGIVTKITQPWGDTMSIYFGSSLIYIFITGAVIMNKW